MHPDRLQLYSINSPNGKKVACMLEETGLPYEAHTVNLWVDEQKLPEFTEISPNGKIPILVDLTGAVDGGPLRIMESAAILLYLAEKAGKFLPCVNTASKSECMQWLFFQVGHIGPMFGQFEHFYRRGDDNQKDEYAINRYRAESIRLMSVLEQQLGSKVWLLGDDYSIADIATFPWISSLLRMDTDGTLNLDLAFPDVIRWHDACLNRPASQKGVTVCAVEG